VSSIRVHIRIHWTSNQVYVSNPNHIMVAYWSGDGDFSAILYIFCLQFLCSFYGPIKYSHILQQVSKISQFLFNPVLLKPNSHTHIEVLVLPLSYINSTTLYTKHLNIIYTRFVLSLYRYWPVLSMATCCYHLRL
jgi:hypothetical protein